MRDQTDINWRKDFEDRLSEPVFGQDDEEFNEVFRKLLLALLDSDNWDKDPSIFIPEEETLGEDLWDMFWHQNTRYQSSLIAVPILSEMLPHVTAVNQRFLIYYLLFIALGAVHWHLEYGFCPSRTHGTYMDDKLGIELHAAVEKYSVPRFLELARTSADPQTRAISLWALGWFPALREDTQPFLQQATLQENDKLIRDAAKFALCMLEKAAHQPEGLDDLEWGDNPDKKLDEEYYNLQRRLLSD
jgi:hypothetical protein